MVGATGKKNNTKNLKVKQAMNNRNELENALAYLDGMEEIADILTRRYPTPRGAWQYDSANGIIEQVV